MTLEDVVMKLVGEVEPCADGAFDYEREKNFDALVRLTATLVNEINYIARYKDSPYGSMALIGQKASDFLANLQEEYF